MEPYTKVIFRKWPDGVILALFPEIPGTNAGGSCSSYVFVGQHGGADYFHCIRTTKPAKPAEYAELKAELENLGYCLITRKRATWINHSKRRDIST